MKYIKALLAHGTARFDHSSWGLLSLLAALTLAPLSAYARDTPEPVARTKPVIDQPHQQKKVARHAHDTHHHHEKQKHQQQRE
jgi:hypothetical protein